MTAVYRFYNTATNTHFYTASIEERNKVLESYPSFNYEGISHYADNNGDLSVFRFYNSATNTHFYTANVEERDYVIATLPLFNYEGVAYKAHSTMNDDADQSLYRFYNTATNSHFYTPDINERDYVIATYPSFNYEGEAFMVSKTPVTNSDTENTEPPEPTVKTIKANEGFLDYGNDGIGFVNYPTITEGGDWLVEVNPSDPYSGVLIDTKEVITVTSQFGIDDISILEPSAKVVFTANSRGETANTYDGSENLSIGFSAGFSLNDEKNLVYDNLMIDASLVSVDTSINIAQVKTGTWTVKMPNISDFSSFSASGGDGLVILGNSKTFFAIDGGPEQNFVRVRNFGTDDTLSLLSSLIENESYYSAEQAKSQFIYNDEGAIFNVSDKMTVLFEGFFGVPEILYY